MDTSGDDGGGKYVAKKRSMDRAKLTRFHAIYSIKVSGAHMVCRIDHTGKLQEAASVNNHKEL